MKRKAISVILVLTLLMSLFTGIQITSFASTSGVPDVFIDLQDATIRSTVIGRSPSHTQMTISSTTNGSFEDWEGNQSGSSNPTYYVAHDGMGTSVEYPITDGTNVATGTKDVYVWVANFRCVYGLEFEIRSMNGQKTDKVYVNPVIADDNVIIGDNGKVEGNAGAVVYLGRYTFLGNTETEIVIERLVGHEGDMLRVLGLKYVDASGSRVSVADNTNLVYMGSDTEKTWVSESTYTNELGTAEASYSTTSTTDIVRFKGSDLTEGYYDISVFNPGNADSETVPQSVTATVATGDGATLKTVELDYTGTSGKFIPVGRFYLKGGDCQNYVELKNSGEGTLRVQSAKFVKIDNYELNVAACKVYDSTGTSPFNSLVTLTRDTKSNTTFAKSSEDIKGAFGEPMGEYSNASDAKISYNASSLQKGWYEVSAFTTNLYGLGTTNKEAIDAQYVINHNGTQDTVHLDTTVFEKYLTPNTPSGSATIGTDCKQENCGEWAKLGTFYFNGSEGENVTLGFGSGNPADESYVLRAGTVKFKPVATPAEYTATNIIRAGRSGAEAVSGVWATTNKTLDDNITPVLLSRIPTSKYKFSYTPDKAGEHEIMYYAVDEKDSTATAADTKVKMTIESSGLQKVMYVNFSGKSDWVSLGKYNLSGASSVTVERLQDYASASNLKTTYATAVKFEANAAETEENEIYFIQPGTNMTQNTGITWGTNSELWYTKALEFGSLGATSSLIAWGGNSTDTFVTYTPAEGTLTEGTHEIYFYVNSNNQNYYATPTCVVVHNGKTDSKKLDLTSVSSVDPYKGYVKVGEYDFVGDGTESITFKVSEDDGQIPTETLIRFGCMKLVSPKSASKAETAYIYKANKAAKTWNDDGTVLHSGSWTNNSGATFTADDETYYAPFLYPTWGEVDSVSASITFKPNAPEGKYEAYYLKAVHANDDSEYTVTTSITAADGNHTGSFVVENNTGMNVTEGGATKWHKLGTYTFKGDGSDELTFSCTNTDQNECAFRVAAIKLVAVSDKDDINPDTVNNVVGRDIFIELSEEVGFGYVSSLTVNTQNQTFTQVGNVVIIPSSAFDEEGDYTINVTNSKGKSLSCVQKVFNAPTTLNITDDNGDGIFAPNVSVGGNYKVSFNLSSSNTQSGSAVIKGNGILIPKISLSGSGTVKGGTYFIDKDTLITIEGDAAVDSITLTYSPANMSVVKFSSGKYANEDNILYANMERFSVDTAILNETTTAASAPKVYIAVYDAEDKLVKLFEAECEKTQINPGEVLEYHSYVSNVTLTSGGHVSVFFLNGSSISPIGSAFVNTYIQS